MMFRLILAKLHRTIFSIRFRLAQSSWRTDDDLCPESPESVIVTSFFSEALGIGRAGELTAKKLNSLGVTVIKDEIRLLYSKLLTKSPVEMAGTSRVWLIHANPPECQIALFSYSNSTWSKMFRIAYWVWETDIIPASWVKTAKWFHQIWVPSKFVFDAFSRGFESAGKPEYTAKLRVVPHPIDQLLQPTRKLSSSVTFLVMYDPRSDHDRKNPLAAICAWKLAFPVPGDAKLIVKTSANAAKYQQFMKLREAAGSRPDISFVAKVMSEAEIEELYGTTDVILSLHRGEGFALTIAEAMARGITPVATAWSGNMEYMNAKNSILIPYTLSPANRRHNGPKANWANSDLLSAAEAIRSLARDSELRAELAARGPATVAKLHEAWNLERLFSSN